METKTGNTDTAKITEWALRRVGLALVVGAGAMLLAAGIGINTQSAWWLAVAPVAGLLGVGLTLGLADATRIRQ